ncbi:MAG TPA: PIG-L deacetylase family protein [Myxococcota bacterium]
MEQGRIPSGIERALAVSAHPDDAEFFAGGTLAALAEGGAEVALVVCTDGGKGGHEVRDLAKTRRHEQAAAADILGVSEVIHLALPDGGLSAGEPLRELLVAAIRRLRPQLVLAHDPRTWFKPAGDLTALGHSDHRAAGAATLDAVYPRAASPAFYPAQLRDPALAPWYPRELWLFDSAQPDFALDVGEGFERKLAALRAHASQERGPGGLVQPARAAAERAGSPEHPVETFARLRLW